MSIRDSTNISTAQSQQGGENESSQPDGAPSKHGVPNVEPRSNFERNYDLQPEITRMEVEQNTSTIATRQILSTNLENSTTREQILDSLNTKSSGYVSEDMPNVSIHQHSIGQVDPYINKTQESFPSLGQQTQWRPTTSTVTSQEDVNKTILDAFRNLQTQFVQQRETETRNAEPPFHFDGLDEEDPEEFLTILKDWLQRSHIQERDTMDRIKKALRGEAAQWFIVTCRSNMEYQIFVTLFREKYNSLHVISNLTVKLYGEEQGSNETAVSFILRKWALYKRLAPNAPESLKVAIIKEQLHSSIKIHLCAAMLTTLQQLINVASQIERHLANDMNPTTTYGQNPVKYRAAPKQSPSPRLNQERRGLQFETERLRTGQPSSQIRNQGDVNGPPFPCRFCGENHFHSDCPRNPRRQQPPTTTQISTTNNFNRNEGNVTRAAATGDARPANNSQR